MCSSRAGKLVQPLWLISLHYLLKLIIYVYYQSAILPLGTTSKNIYIGTNIRNAILFLEAFVIVKS